MAQHGDDPPSTEVDEPTPKTSTPGLVSYKTDLLNPLARVTWEYCHTGPWEERDCPTHVSALHDTVAVLTSRGIGVPDTLFLSSTNLHSWTRIDLSYKDMSLAIYQSKLVLVGGRHDFTHEPTNELLTSTTGLQWEPSLPAMPTRRYLTSSVSTRSPEVLVVAGGRDSNDEDLDVVEVLQGEEWLMVDPLPAPASDMSSTLHDGELCFMGRWDGDSTVFTCSCTSLISSCSKSSDKSSTDRPLWQEFQAPQDDGGTTVVSCSSRLVNIDGMGRVRGYSSMSRSWLTITSTGPTPNEDGYTATTVLDTGELILAHYYSGIYRGAVSVSLFSPDRRFLSEDLTKLEAVMGIRIVSVLASHASQLASLFGVKPLPQPLSQSAEEYVENLISWWCAGFTSASVSPTWKHLLEAISGVGLPELRTEIEAFMKEELKYKKAYHHFISTKKTLEMLFLKFLFSGPPRLGKTTALRRLMGEIADLMSAGEADRVHASTGAVESGSDMIVKCVSSGTAVVTKAEWCAAKSRTDEARMLFLQLKWSMETEDATPTTTTSIPVVEKLATRTMGEATAATPTTTPHQRPKSGFLMKLRRKFMSTIRRNQAQSPPDIVAAPSPDSEAAPSPDSATAETADVPLIAELFKKASEQPEFLEEIQHHFRAFLRIEDTGGQPELMDMLPALTIGPGLYLIFFNLEWNLKKEFKVFYQHPSGNTTTPEESKITLEEMLLSTLSSISCSSVSANLLRDIEANSSDMREILKSSKSVAYLVGTHKDKVSEEHISQLDKDLQSIIRGTDFFEKELVKFCSEGKLIVTMDNMNGGVEEVNAIREMLDTAMERHFKPLRIPAVWLLFNLCLAQTNKRTASMKSVLELSSQFNMSAEETKVALWFLHHHAGVMMYFPNVPLLQDLVILDTQVVYDSVTFLILRAMNFENVGQACSEKFRVTGQFVLEDLVAATSRVPGGDFILPEKLIALLEFLHIIAPIPKVQGSLSSPQELKAVYLMPCVLRIASKEDLDAICHDQPHPQCVAPLLVRYKCGFVPLGIFPALIASLISHNSFKLVKQDMMKNKVQFLCGPRQSLVSLLCYPKFYAIVISKLPVVAHQIHEECVDIRQQVVAALGQVSSRMNYGYFLNYQFAFQCPNHPEKEHVCVVDTMWDTPQIMNCLHNQEPVEMKCNHIVWFYKGKDDAVPLEPEKKNYLEMSAVGLDHVLKDADIPALLEVLTWISNKWEQLANALGLPGHLVAQCRNDSFILSMNAIIREWMAGNGITPITLGTLKTKLESATMGEKVFAKDLIANFNKLKLAGASPPQSTSPEAATPGCVADSASATSPSLTVGDLSAVLNEVIDVKAQWKVIGLQLGVSIGDLKGIGADGNDIEDKLIETLTMWLQSGKNTTWKALAEAMGSPSVKHEALKRKILANHPC